MGIKARLLKLESKQPKESGHWRPPLAHFYGDFSKPMKWISNSEPAKTLADFYRLPPDER